MTVGYLSCGNPTANDICARSQGETKPSYSAKMASNASDTPYVPQERK